MRITVTLALMLCAAPAFASAGAPSEPKTYTLSSGAIAASDDPAVRVYALYGTILKPDVADCDAAWKAWSDEVHREYPRDSIYLNAMAMCAMSPGGVAEFAYNFIFEAKDADGVPALEAYMADHTGREVLGVTIAYRRAFGVYTTLRLAALDFATGDDGSQSVKTVEEFTRDTMYVNQGQVMKWSERAKEGLEGTTVEQLLAWSEAEFGAWAPYVLRNGALAHANVLSARPSMVFVLEDRTLVHAPMGFVGAWRDCRQTASGRCDQ